MRILLICCLLLTAYVSQAQFDKKIVGPIKLRTGLEFREGDTLLLGRGTRSDGTFTYINEGILAGTSDDPLPANHAHTMAVIKLFRVRRVGQSNKLYASLKAGTLYGAFADLDAAVAAKEIIAINGQEIGKPRANTQSPAANSLTASNNGGPAKTSAGDDAMTVKPFSNDVNIRILSIEGNKSQQTVTVNFVLKTELPHQQVMLLYSGCNTTRGEGKAYDSDGTEYNLKSMSLGNVSDRDFGVKNKLPTSVPLKGSITFANVLPKVSGLSFITFRMSSANYDGGEHCQEGNVEIRNAKIEWK